MTSSGREQVLVQQAFLCLQAGYFEGALERCNKLERLKVRRRTKGNHIAWLARAYLSSGSISSRRMRDAEESMHRLAGGQGMPELAVLHLRGGRRDAAIRMLDIALATARAQHGVLVACHPSAVLELASFAIGELGDPRRAVDLVNLALGHRGVYAALEDIGRLADLLSGTEAPLALWADWGAAFVMHVHFATVRHRLLAELEDDAAITWAKGQDAASERVLRRVLECGPSGLRELLSTLAPHLDATSLADVLRERFPESGTFASRTSPRDGRWWEADSLRFRYWWHDLISEQEQTMVLNGDWAMFNTPTTDFSMALAQWWRALESILKRSVARELAQLFQRNPDWVAWDRENLGEAQQKKEEVFIKKLSDPKKAEQTTLGDLMLILKKCLAEETGSTRSGSRLRLEASRHLGRFTQQLRPLVEQAWLRPVHLTDANITWFRNRASHDAAIGSCDGFVGRTLARRVLDGFFAPVLHRNGFVARIEM